MVATPPNATVAPVGVPTPLRLRGTMSIPDAAQDVLPITVAETWTVITCVVVCDALPCACAVADACVRFLARSVVVTVVNLRHDTAGDLRISLRSPSAADAVFLFNNNVRTRVSLH